MELLLREGEYVADGRGGVVRLEGEEALLGRVLFRLTARRGGCRGKVAVRRWQGRGRGVSARR